MFGTVLDYIARTNLFNFIIFAAIIIYIIAKLDVSAILGKGAKGVEEKIDNSENAKKDSEVKLQTITDKVANIETETESIIKKSEENAELVGGQILNDASKTVDNIKVNTQKLIGNKTGIIKNDILKRASFASVETAREHIINELNNNPDLHNKLIDESINAIGNNIN